MMLYLMAANYRMDWCRSDLNYRDWTGAAMAANNRGWTGSAMAATGVVITASCTVAATAANYSGWNGAVHNASCITPPLRQWLQTTAAGLVR